MRRGVARRLTHADQCIGVGTSDDYRPSNAPACQSSYQIILHWGAVSHPTHVAVTLVTLITAPTLSKYSVSCIGLFSFLITIPVSNLVIFTEFACCWSQLSLSIRFLTSWSFLACVCLFRQCKSSRLMLVVQVPMFARRLLILPMNNLSNSLIRIELSLANSSLFTW